MLLPVRVSKGSIRKEIEDSLLATEHCKPSRRGSL